MKRLILPILTLLAVSAAAQQEPKTQQTYVFTETYTTGSDLAASCKLVATAMGYNDPMTDSFNLLYSVRSYYYDTMVIEGNIRYSSEFEMNENSEIFIMPNTYCILGQARFKKNAVIYNYGRLNLSSFKAADTVIIINEPGGMVFADFHKFSNGDYMIGNCGEGAALIVEGRDNLIPQTTGVNNVVPADVKWEHYAIISIDGKFIAQGRFEELEAKLETLNGIFVVRTWNNKYSHSIKRCNIR